MVWSPRLKDVQAIRKVCGPDFFIVTPGIRPAGHLEDDQKRIVTPAAGY